MKHLKINAGKAQFSLDGNSWNDIDKLTKNNLLQLIDLVLKEEFDMDNYQQGIITNPAHDIIYRNLHTKFSELSLKRDRFKDESQQLYREALQKYKV